MSDPSSDELPEEGEEEYLPDPAMLQIAERYAPSDGSKGEKVADLADEFGISKSTVYDNFKKMGITTGQRAQRRKALETVRKVETETLAEEAERIASMAIKLGGVIVRRYGPLLDVLMAQGKSLELIAEEIMSWFEDKRSTTKLLIDLETQRDILYGQLEEAYGIALPNYKYELRTRLLNRYAVDVLRARTIGVKIPVKRTLKAFYNDLLILEGDIEDIMVKSIER